MGKRGTKGEQRQKISAIEPAPKTRLKPPSYFTAKQKMYWDEVVNAWPPGHFISSDYRMLESFACAVDARNKAQDHVRRFGQIITSDTAGLKTNPSMSIIVQANSSIQQLSTKLRIAVNSRVKNHQSKAETKAPVSDKRAGLMFKG